MSTYNDFYAAIKKDDKIEAIGPYIRKEGEYRLVPIVSRSRSFIHFDEFGYWELPIEKMAEDQVEFFTSEGWTSDERHSISCYIPYEDIRAMADDGLVQGYVTLDELDMVAANDYNQDSLWDLWVKTPEMIAEMDPETRKEYGHIAYIDHFSTGYICRQLINAVDPYEYGYSTAEVLNSFEYLRLLSLVNASSPRHSYCLHQVLMEVSLTPMMAAMPRKDIPSSKRFFTAYIFSSDVHLRIEKPQVSTYARLLTGSALSFLVCKGWDKRQIRESLRKGCGFNGRGIGFLLEDS